MNPGLSSDLMTRAEVKTSARISNTTLHKLLNEGVLERVKIGAATRITRESYEKWLRSLRNPPKEARRV